MKELLGCLRFVRLLSVLTICQLHVGTLYLRIFSTPASQLYFHVQLSLPKKQCLGSRVNHITLYFNKYDLRQPESVNIKPLS